MRGLFIVFEGLDGSGQDTQAQLLADVLTEAGRQVWLTREPTDSAVGKNIRQILRGEVANPGAWVVQSMMTRDRGLHVKNIDKAVKEGVVVISIRYYYSTFAYGQAGGLDYLSLWRMNKGFIRPDVTIYLDVNPTIAIQRISKRGNPIELFEQQEFLQKVRRNFCKMIQDNDFPELKLIDATGDISTVHRLVMTAIRVATK
ncbi:dTMP kinase [Patescibacteria group bacterium]|nr:dTMP kinase [Patescibacteria group bacterium]